jgi:hypothetical protein
MFAPFSFATAQQPGIPDWTIGWEDDDTVFLELDSNKRFNVEIEGYVENTRLTPVEIFFEVSLDNEDVFSVAFPETMTVSAGSNSSFQITISGIGKDSDGKMYDADQVFDTLELSAEEKIAGTSIGSKQIEKDLQFAAYHELIPSTIKSEIGDLQSGSDEKIKIYVDNEGNSADSVSKVNLMIRGCPLLDISGQDLLVGKAIASGSSISQEITISAPSNHASKKCTVEITITSEGSDRSSSTDFEIKVEAPETSSSSNSGSDNGQNTNQQNNDFEVESNSLPAPSFISCLLVLIFTAIVRRN